jgi:hypothetical protein
VTPEFLEGPIARDYREILESATTYEAATRQKSGTGGTKCKSGGKDCNVPTEGNKCKTGAGCGNVPTGGNNCKTGEGCNVPTGGKNCKSDRKICPKAHAFHSSVPGWSQPPAPPVA